MPSLIAESLSSQLDYSFLSGADLLIRNSTRKRRISYFGTHLLSGSDPVAVEATREFCHRLFRKLKLNESSDVEGFNSSLTKGGEGLCHEFTEEAGWKAFNEGGTVIYRRPLSEERIRHLHQGLPKPNTFQKILTFLLN